MTSTAANNPPEAASRPTTHPYLGVAGVLLGTMIGRTPELLAVQVRRQAFTLAISARFILIATCCVTCLLVVAFMFKLPKQYQQIIASSAEAK